MAGVGQAAILDKESTQGGTCGAIVIAVADSVCRRSTQGSINPRTVEWRVRTAVCGIAKLLCYIVVNCQPASAVL